MSMQYYFKPLIMDSKSKRDDKKWGGGIKFAIHAIVKIFDQFPHPSETIRCHAMEHNNATRCAAMRCNAMGCDAMPRRDAMPCYTMQRTENAWHAGGFDENVYVMTARMPIMKRRGGMSLMVMTTMIMIMLAVVMMMTLIMMVITYEEDDPYDVQNDEAGTDDT